MCAPSVPVGSLKQLLNLLLSNEEESQFLVLPILLRLHLPLNALGFPLVNLLSLMASNTTRVVLLPRQSKLLHVVVLLSQ